MTEYIIHRDDDLKHYGVKGTHWGIRRYQNEDGSYKPGAEGRYYQPINGGRSVSVSTSKNSTSAARALHESRGSMIEEGRKTGFSGSKKNVSTTGGGSSASGSSSQPVKPAEKDKEEEKTAEEKKETAERAIDKTRDGKDIAVKDASEKVNTSADASSSKKTSSGSSKSSSASTKESSFKVSDLTDKINNFFDMDDMTDEDWNELELDDKDVDEIDELITKYRAWRSANSSNTKKTKKIDEFIERYTAWRSNRKTIKHTGIIKGVLGMKWKIERHFLI